MVQGTLYRKADPSLPSAAKKRHGKATTSHTSFQYLYFDRRISGPYYCLKEESQVGVSLDETFFFTESYIDSVGFGLLLDH